MSGRWLVKSEPSNYGWDDLVRDGETLWDGIRNAQAANFLKAMRVGDPVIFYHSGAGAAAVGLAEVTAEAAPDPKDETGRFVAVRIKVVRPFSSAVALVAIKADTRLSGLLMLRQSRLSVSPVGEAEWEALLALGG